MKLSKSKLALAKIINENGGWVDYCEGYAAQDGDCVISFYEFMPKWIVAYQWWSLEYYGRIGEIAGVSYRINNHHQTILSREEYYKAYPKADADGWIEWNGGECPVDGDSIVDVEFNFSAGHTVSGAAKGLSWRHEWKYSNIIKYRLHKPEAKPEFCESVTRSIPEPESIDGLCAKVTEENNHQHVDAKPTIEQLAQDYRDAKDYALRLQKEAGEAAVKAESFAVEIRKKILELQELIGISKPESEPELVIADWRDLLVGDVVECVSANCSPDKFNGMTGEVIAIDYSCDGQPVKVLLGGHEIWCYEVKFIRRP